MRDEIVLLGSLINSLIFSKCAGIKTKIDVFLIFIYYCNFFPTRWQWSIDLYKNREETAQKEKQYKNREETAQKEKQYKNMEETAQKEKQYKNREETAQKEKQYKNREETAQKEKQYKNIENSKNTEYTK